MKIKEYFKHIPVTDIRVSPFHFRKESAKEKLDDLVNSIKEVGLIHAVSVVRNPTSKGYELINGHRRLLAHKKAGLKRIRCTVYEYESAELADEATRRQAIAQFLLAANKAEPLIPLERARYYDHAMDKFGWEISEIARVHHVTEESIADDLMFLNLESETLDLVKKHPDSFTTETLGILAQFATPSAKKSWVMTPQEQVRVAEKIALQTDKKLIESTRALTGHITQVVKARKDKAAAERRKVGRGTADPVQGLWKILEGVQRIVDDLVKTDLSPIKEIHPADKGKAAEQLYAAAEQLIDFAEGPLQKLPVKRPPKATGRKATKKPAKRSSKKVRTSVA